MNTSSKDHRIGGSELGSLDLTAKHLELVAQDGDLDVLGVLALRAAEQHADEPACHEVKEGQAIGRLSPTRSSLLSTAGRVSEPCGRDLSPPSGPRAAGTAEGMPEDPHPLPPPTAWFARDAERHLLDAPRHCPRCGGPVSGPAGLVVEYWVADDRVFYCWCRACDWTRTVTQVDRHIGHETAG